MFALHEQLEYMTLEQYEKLPENVRVEIFEDIAYDMAGASSTHQRISMRLSTILNNYIMEKDGKCEVFHAPYDVKLSDDPLTIVQPDIMVICDPEKIDEKRCNGAPDFIIEIVSPGNPENDYVRKLYYYEKSGVREYWIVDPERKIVTVNDFAHGVLSVQHDFSETVKVNIYEDLEIDFKEVEAVVL